MKRVICTANRPSQLSKAIASQSYGYGTIGEDGVLHSDDLLNFIEEILGGRNIFDFLTDEAIASIEKQVGKNEYDLDSIGVDFAVIKSNTIIAHVCADYRVWRDGDSHSIWEQAKFNVAIPVN